MAQNGDRARGRKHDRPPAKTLYAAREGAGSLRGAARVLGVPPSTAARWYRELEREGDKAAPPAALPELEAPDWSDPKAVRAWQLERWRQIALGDGAAALAAVDRLGAASGADKIGTDTDGAVNALSRADAIRLRAFGRRQSFWIGRLIQSRIARHETSPADDPTERNRDERLRAAWIPVARLESTDLEPLIAVLREYGDPCSI